MRILHNNQKLQDIRQPSPKDRIATIEAELFNLRARHDPTSHIRLRAQKARVAIIDDEDEEEVAAIRKGKQPQIVEVEEEPAASQPDVLPVKKTTTPTASTSTSQPIQAAEYSYQPLKNIAYQPPVLRNIGAPIKTTFNKHNTTPELLPPIYDPSISANAYKRSLDASVTVTQRELLALAPQVCSRAREAITSRSIPLNNTATAQNLYRYSDNQQADKNLATVTVYSAQSLSPSSIVINQPLESDPIAQGSLKSRHSQNSPTDITRSAQPSNASIATFLSPSHQPPANNSIPINSVPYTSSFTVAQDSSPAAHNSKSEIYLKSTKYKPVALKIESVKNTPPSQFHIVRNVIGDPLANF